MRRWTSTTALVAIGAATLTGCSPAELPLVAIHLDTSGNPSALISPCGDDRTAWLELTSWSDAWASAWDAEQAATDPAASASASAAAAAAEAADEDIRWQATPTEPVGATEFPVFAPPASWHAQATGPQELRPDRTYSLSFRVPGQGANYTAHVDFTAADLATLHRREVWADGRAMTEEGFARLVRKKC